MRTPRLSPTATVLADGRVLVAGGGLDEGLATSAVEIYDPGRDQWAETAALPEGLMNHGAARLRDGQVLFFGGWKRTAEGSRSVREVLVYERTEGAQ